MLILEWSYNNTYMILCYTMEVHKIICLKGETIILHGVALDSLSEDDFL